MYTLNCLFCIFEQRPLGLFQRLLLGRATAAGNHTTRAPPLPIVQPGNTEDTTSEAPPQRHVEKRASVQEVKGGGIFEMVTNLESWQCKSSSERRSGTATDLESW